MPANAIEQYKKWNVSFNKSNASIDKKFVRTLIIICCRGKENVSAQLVNDAVVDFVRTLCEVRVENNENRMDAIGGYIKEFVKECETQNK